MFAQWWSGRLRPMSRTEKLADLTCHSLSAATLRVFSLLAGRQTFSLKHLFNFFSHQKNNWLIPWVASPLSEMRMRMWQLFSAFSFLLCYLWKR